MESTRWPNINDIAAAMPVTILKSNQTISDIISGYGLQDILLLIPYIVVLLVILRPSKLESIWSRWMQEQKNEHPAPFPVALIDRIIKSTYAQVVLDPFMGSGTTAVAAKALGRDYIGFEISEKYVELANARIDGTQTKQKKEYSQLEIF